MPPPWGIRVDVVRRADPAGYLGWPNAKQAMRPLARGSVRGAEPAAVPTVGPTTVQSKTSWSETDASGTSGAISGGLRRSHASSPDQPAERHRTRRDPWSALDGRRARACCPPSVFWSRGSSFAGAGPSPNQTRRCFRALLAAERRGSALLESSDDQHLRTAMAAALLAGVGLFCPGVPGWRRSRRRSIPPTAACGASSKQSRASGVNSTEGAPVRPVWAPHS